MAKEYVIVYGNSPRANVANISFKRKLTRALSFMRWCNKERSLQWINGNVLLHIQMFSSFYYTVWNDKQQYNFQDNWTWTHLRQDMKIWLQIVFVKHSLVFILQENVVKQGNILVIQKSPGMSLWQYQVKYRRR